MNIQTDKAYMIFRKPYEDRVFYSIGLSKKNASGGYDKGYMPVQFKNGVDVPDQTKIYLKHAWISFYTRKKSVNGAEYTETVPYIFVNEFATMQDQIDKYHVDFDEIEARKNNTSISENKEPTQEQNDLFEEFGQEIEINESDLPF